MKRISKLQLVVLVTVVVTTGFLLFRLRLVNTENQSLEADLSRVRAEAAAMKAALERQVAELKQFARENAVRVPATAVVDAENELDAWLNRVECLQRFTAAHPEYSIPELRHLRAKDWLEATKDAKLETEADYRIALCTVRYAAKERVARKLNDALQKCLQSAGGQLPGDVSTIKAYLTDEESPLLDRYQLNPSGKLSGVSFGSGSGAVLVENPVDPVWDTRLFFTTDSMGMKGANTSYAAKVDNAIAAYRRANGAEPTDCSQISSLLEPTMDDEVLKEVFRAVRTPVRLP